MKRLLTAGTLILCAFGSLAAQTKQLKSFDELMRSLKAGKEVRAVIHYAKCKLVIDSVETTSPDAVGGMSLSTFEYFARMSVRNPKAFVSSSETVLISHPRYGYVHNLSLIHI